MVLIGATQFSSLHSTMGIYPGLWLLLAHWCWGALALLLLQFGALALHNFTLIQHIGATNTSSSGLLVLWCYKF